MTTWQLTEEIIILPHYSGSLLEGITYDKRNNSLLWVDIAERSAHRVFLDNDDGTVRADTHQTLQYHDESESIGAIALTRDCDVILVCAKRGIAYGDFSKNTIHDYFVTYPCNPRLRSNDGIVDPWGNLWIGLMTDFAESRDEGSALPEGYLYRIDCQLLECCEMLNHTIISNGISFTRDGKQVYWTDSGTHTIWAFDYDRDRNSLTNRRVHVDMRDHLGSEACPDGMRLLQDGRMYSAIFGMGLVVCLSGDGKKVEQQYKLPASRITCMTVGGPRNSTLYVTSAHSLLERERSERDAYSGPDLGGRLFAIPINKPFHQVDNHIWGGDERGYATQQ